MKDQPPNVATMGQKTMRAVVQDRYGPLDELTVGEIPVPEPGPGQVLVQVMAAGIDPSIWHIKTGLPYVVRPFLGLTHPKHRVPGWDVAGVVAAVGHGVDRLRVGDAVFGAAVGALAEFAVGKEKNLASMPDTIGFEEAATVPTSAVTALQALRAGNCRQGAKVAVLGAGGGVGAYAVQLARIRGATVTGVCSTGKVDMVRALGANHVIDYTAGDILERDDRYDVIVDTAGNRPLLALRRILSEGGRLILVGGERPGRPVFGMGRALRAPLLSIGGTKRFKMLLAKHDPDDMEILRSHLADRSLRVPLDRVFGIDRTVEALHYVQSGQALGKVAIRI